MTRAKDTRTAILTPADVYRSELVEIYRARVRAYEARPDRELWQDDIDFAKAAIAFILRHDTQPPITLQQKQAHARALKLARELFLARAAGGRNPVTGGNESDKETGR